MTCKHFIFFMACGIIVLLFLALGETSLQQVPARAQAAPMPLPATDNRVLLSTTNAPTDTAEFHIFLPCVIADPVLPVCNDFELSDVPDNQELLATVNACCRSETKAAQDGEDDYYMVVLQPGNTITTTLTHIPQQADYDLVLYDQGLDNYLAFSTKRNQADEQMVYTALVAGNYYIRVILYDTALANSYRLCVDVE